MRRSLELVTLQIWWKRPLSKSEMTFVTSPRSIHTRQSQISTIYLSSYLRR
jgi:hypothetical protein